MAARRRSPARSTKPVTTPVEGNLRGAESGEDDDESGAGDDHEGDGEGDEDPDHEPAELDDDGDEDEEPAEPELESTIEIRAAEALAKEENTAALRAHDALQSKARGNRTSAAQVRKAIEDAKDKVRRKHLLKRKPGIYTAQPLTTTNEKGERIQCPPFMRLPDSIVARLKKQRDLRRLIDSGVLEDLR